MKKTVALFLVLIFSLSVASVSLSEENNVIAFPSAGHVIGIAWRTDTDNEFCTNAVRAVEAVGGVPVILGQVMSADLSYDENGKLLEGVDPMGALTESAGKLVRTNTWYGSNAAEVLQDIDSVIFTGGEDISSSLFFTQVPWHGIVAEIDYNAERDISDYLTMAYCLDHGIAVLGFCRGMQMLSVLSGAEMIQDVPAYFAGQGVPYAYEHRNNKASPDSYRDYAPHAADLAPGSLVREIFGADRLEGCPSWHHQAVGSVADTRLKVTASLETGGIEIIEAVERTDKAFAVGLQFHPEAAVVKHLDGAENADLFMDYETAIRVFEFFVNGNAEAVPDAA